MDLSSLLNNQKDTSLSFHDVQTLLANPDSSVILDKIRSNTAFKYPSNKQDSFSFFDSFIRLLLCIDLEDDPYSAQYTKSIMMDAFRTCVNGLLQLHGNTWLIEFPFAISAKTWVALRKQSNVTLLVCLYGIALTLATHDTIKSLLQFMRSNYVGILVHLWLTCCSLDTTQAFLEQLNARLVNEPQYTIQPVKEMLVVIKKRDIKYLTTHVYQYLGNALTKAYSKDDFVVAQLELENQCQLKNINRFGALTKIHLEQSRSQIVKKNNKANPLINPELLEEWKPDKYEQIQSVRKGTLFWIQKMAEMTPSVFDMYLEKLIIQHYPTDRKTVLDLLLADWTIRDRFHRHLDFVSNIMATLLTTTKYNKRSAPYYAFIQLFNQQHETASYYETKSGAYIDLSQFSHQQLDSVLLEGCCHLLQNLTTRSVSGEWIAGCLTNASADIVQHYASWYGQGLNQELEVKTTNCYAPYLASILKACTSQSQHVLPTLLQSLSVTSLQWVMKSGDAVSILVHYFDDGAQVSKYMMIQSLFMTKEKQWMDVFMTYLRELMPGTNPKLPRSRAWFKNHFLGVILSLVGDDVTGKGVACCVFRQLFKSRDEFEWYFATPLTDSKMDFKSLDLASTHAIYAVKHSGLAAMLQEMCKLGDKKERLVKVWFELWTAQNSKFTVPVSWILQCAGLYDQAPVLVKQMIKQFVTIGLQLRQGEENIMSMVPERKFSDRMMDLVLLSDTPEPDNLFELLLTLSQQSLEDINWSIINILVELSEELEVELSLLDSPASTPKPPSPMKVSNRERRKHTTQRKLRDAMKKHEEELEKYLQESKNKNNAIKALTTLVQRVFNFLLRLLNNVDVQHSLVYIPLFYEPLSKLAKLIREPHDLHEDIQTTIDLCLEYLKKTPEVYETSRKLLGIVVVKE